MNDDIKKVKYEGQTYYIPGIWLYGFTQPGDRTILDAVKCWHEQAELEKLRQKQVAR